jgi:carboxylesterase
MSAVRPGAEAWAAEGGDVGVLCLHGFSGSPASMRPLAERLADEGYAVELPRLPGHGTHWRDLDGVAWQDWAREVVAAHDRLVACTRARVVVGQSVGGALACYLAATRRAELAGLVVVNPDLYRKHPLLVFMPVLKRVLRSWPGVVNDIAKRGQDEIGYERLPPKAIAEYLALQRIVRDDLAAIDIPTLVFTSRVDHVVDPANSTFLIEHIGSDDVTHTWLERCFHVATLDHDAPQIEEETLAFVKRVTA